MPRLEHCHEPGLLYVLSQPKHPRHQADFDDWYNTEHGPLRLKLDFVQNGYRYRSREQQQQQPTTWLAIYDLRRLSAAAEDRYTSLRKNRSRREQLVLQNAVNILSRQFFRLVSTHGSADSGSFYIQTSTFSVKIQDAVAVGRHFDQIIVSCLSSYAGWRRSRRLVLVDDPDNASGWETMLLVHEFDKRSDCETATARLWTMAQEDEVISKHIRSRDERSLDFYHEFRARDYRAPPEPTNAGRSAAEVGEISRSNQLLPTRRIVEAI